MPALLGHAECSSCGKRHNFCFLGGDALPAGRAYRYRCPETGKEALVRPESGRESVRYGPQGAVPLTLAVDGQAAAPWRGDRGWAGATDSPVTSAEFGG